MGIHHVTRADVARHANVSETIVSYVINDNRYVNAEKRKRVLQAIEELHYQPNPVARMLKGKSSNHILFIVDQVANEHFGNIITAMNQAAYDKGYLISLIPAQNTEDFITRIIARQFDGIIISSISFPESLICRLNEADIPIILLMNRKYANLPDNVGKIYTGLYEGMYDNVNILLNSGIQYPVYLDRISQHGYFSDNMDLRYMGFIDALSTHGIAYTPDHLITGCTSTEQVYEAIVDKIRTSPVDAFVARHDRIAGICINAVQETGLSIPGDISITGFDNSSLSQFIQPHLTTVQINAAEIGSAAVAMLENIVQGKKPETLQLSTKRIVRQTTQ